MTAGNLLEGVLFVLSLDVLPYLFAGVALGFILGLLPGLGAIQGIALVLPLTFGLDSRIAMVLLGSIYMVSNYSSAITSILVNTPGDPSSGATVFDGYPMAQRGEAASAIGAATLASFVGGVAGVVLFAFGAPSIAVFAIRVGAPDKAALAILGLVIIGIASTDQLAKGLVSGGIGLMLSFVGFGAVVGYPRFTFGSVQLQGGISFIALTVGIFALSEAFFLIERGGSVADRDRQTNHHGALRGVRQAIGYRGTLTRSTLIGLVIGVIPGLGAATANFLAYGEERRTSRTPELFGTGHLPGVMAPEASNNATVGASLVPTLVLGIPGSAGSAVLLGGLIMYGIIPGENFFRTNASVFSAFVAALFLSCVIFAVVGLAGARFATKLTYVRVEILAPCVVIIALLAAYATRANYFDIVVCFIAGGLGYLMRKFGYPLVPLLMGFVLGPIWENAVIQTTIISGGSLTIYVQRPLSLMFLLLAVLIIASRARQVAVVRRRMGPGEVVSRRLR